MATHVFNSARNNEYLLFGVHLKVLLTAEQTNGQFSLVEGTMPPGGDSGLHVHHREDESMHIMEGSLEVTIGAETQILGAGDSYFAPRGIPHRLRNLGDTPMRSHMIATPGEFASFVMEAGIPIPESGDMPPVTPPTPAQMEVIGKLLHKWGIEMLVPPGT